MKQYWWFSCCCVGPWLGTPLTAAVSLIKCCVHSDIVHMTPYFTSQWAGKALADSLHTPQPHSNPRTPFWVRTCVPYLIYTSARNETVRYTGRRDTALTFPPHKLPMVIQRIHFLSLQQAVKVSCITSMCCITLSRTLLQCVLPHLSWWNGAPTSVVTYSCDVSPGEMLLKQLLWLMSPLRSHPIIR